MPYDPSYPQCTRACCSQLTCDPTRAGPSIVYSKTGEHVLQARLPLSLSLISLSPLPLLLIHALSLSLSSSLDRSIARSLARSLARRVTPLLLNPRATLYPDCLRPDTKPAVFRQQSLTDGTLVHHARVLEGVAESQFPLMQRFSKVVNRMLRRFTTK